MKKIKGYNIVKEKTNELLVSIEVGNDEVIERNGYKVIPFYEEGNPTIEQNAGENRIEGGVLSVSGCVLVPWYVIEDDGKYYVQNYIGTTGNGIEKVMCKGTREECQKWKEEHEQKKEKYYRPFNNCEELIEYFSDCIDGIVFRPLIWVKHKRYGTENLIIAFDNDNESIGGSCVFVQDIWLDMQELFDNFTFLDGSPVGKLEEV